MSIKVMKRNWTAKDEARKAKPWNFLNVKDLTKDQIYDINKYLGHNMCKEDPEISIKENAVIVYWDDASQYRLQCDSGSVHEIFDFYTENRDAAHIKHKIKKTKR